MCCMKCPRLEGDALRLYILTMYEALNMLTITSGGSDAVATVFWVAHCAVSMAAVVDCPLYVPSSVIDTVNLLWS